MVEVYVTIGYKDIFFSTERVLMRYPSLPRIGDVIVLTPELRRMVDAKKKEWKVIDKSARLNYVRSVAYQNDSFPTVILGLNPALIDADVWYENEYIGCIGLKTAPRIGDIVHVTGMAKCKFISSIEHAENCLNIELSDNCHVPNVYVLGQPLSVDVHNVVEVDIVRSFNTVDVRIVDKY